MIPFRRMHARIAISAEAIEAAVAYDRNETTRLERAGVPLKQARKAKARARAFRFYRDYLKPEMGGLLSDLANHYIPLSSVFTKDTKTT